MKHLASLFLLSFLALLFLFTQMDDEWKPNDQVPNVPRKPTRLAFLSVGLVLKLLLNMELQRSVFMSTCKIPWYMEKISHFK